MDTKGQSQTLLQDLKLDNLPEEKKNQLTNQLAGILQDRISVRILETLTEEDKKKFDEAIASGDEQKANEFLANNVPALDAIAREEYESLRGELIQRNEAIIDAINSKAQGTTPQN